jgi:hypothetical protein
VFYILIRSINKKLPDQGEKKGKKKGGCALL